MRSHRFLLTGAAALLASCGGGGSGSVGSVVVTPSPSPTASPSPAPTPTATPTPTAFAPFDLTRDQFFELFVAQRATGASAPSASINDTTTFRYTAASEEARLTLLSGETFVFPASLLATRQTDFRFYEQRTPYRSLNITRPARTPGNPAGGTLSYLVTVANEEPGVFRAALGGSATPASGLRPAGSAAYNFVFASTRSDTSLIKDGDASFIIDFSARRFSGSFRTVTVANASGPTVTLEGELNASGRLQGSIATSDGDRGTLSGRLYGPAGEEFGFAFSLSGPFGPTSGLMYGYLR